MRSAVKALSFLSSTAIALLIYAPPVLADAGAPPATIEDLNYVFRGVLSIVVIAGGFLAFIALIIGGFRYIISRGDPKATTAARGAITWAILGLAFIIIAWLILKFIADFTGLTQLTKFCIGSSCY